MGNKIVAIVLEAAVGPTERVVAPDKRVSIGVRDPDSITKTSKVLEAKARFLVASVTTKQKDVDSLPKKQNWKMTVLNLSAGWIGTFYATIRRVGPTAKFLQQVPHYFLYRELQPGEKTNQHTCIRSIPRF